MTRFAILIALAALAGNAVADHLVVEGKHPFADNAEFSKYSVEEVGSMLAELRAAWRADKADSTSSVEFINGCVNIDWEDGYGSLLPHDAWHRMTQADLEKFKFGFATSCCEYAGREACGRWLRSIGVQVEAPRPSE